MRVQGILDILKKLFKPNPKPTSFVTRLVLIVLVAFMSGFLGYSYGFYTGTGIPPFTHSEAILLPEVNINVTAQQVSNFVAADDTTLNKYDIGFNCVEYALLLARNAAWAGIPAEVVKVDLEGNTDHIILAFPTEDKGWLFIDPATSIQLNPRVGGMLGDKKIVGLYILRAEWVPFEEVNGNVKEISQ